MQEYIAMSFQKVKSSTSRCFDISTAALHIIAMLFMLMDHLWATLLPAQEWLTCVGRIAFPIFAFMSVEGYFHTHNFKKYLLRMLVFAVISEIPFDLAFSSKILEFNYQNVFFTLFIGLLTMIAYRAVEEKEEWNQALKVILYILIVAAGMALAYFLKTDYAEKGVFCIMVLYIFRKKKMWQLIAGCASFIWETPALFGFIPIAFYNGTRGWKMKYFFYIFYPAHLLILYLICYFMGISGYSAV